MLMKLVTIHKCYTSHAFSFSMQDAKLESSEELHLVDQFTGVNTGMDGI